MVFPLFSKLHSNSTAAGIYSHHTRWFVLRWIIENNTIECIEGLCSPKLLTISTLVLHAEVTSDNPGSFQDPGTGLPSVGTTSKTKTKYTVQIQTLRASIIFLRLRMPLCSFSSFAWGRSNTTLRCLSRSSCCDCGSIISSATAKREVSVVNWRCTICDCNDYIQCK